MRTSVMRLVEALRRLVPPVLVPVLAALRARVAWSRAAVREDAREQMRFLLEHTRPDADLERAARSYVRSQALRGELRWHPRMITGLRVVGVEHLLAARAEGRGVLLNFMHHGHYDGAFPSLARHGVTCKIMVHAYTLQPDAPGWLKQHSRIGASGGSELVPTDIGAPGITELLGRGNVVAIASDVPGRTPLRFAGRDVLGSFGAARLAAEADAPVVLLTSEWDEQGHPFVRLHEPLHPSDFASPGELLARMLQTHESVLVRWPERTDIPLSRWGAVPARAAAA